ncbi:hypothetical protein [Methanosphaera sp.]
MVKIADKNSSFGAAGIGFYILIIIIVIFGGVLAVNASSPGDINDNNLVNEDESLPIINMTNTTLNDYKITFVYYDHNTTNWNGCYGLNYTVLTDNEGNKYMLDHATTDILGQKTNYTFKYPDGIGLVFDNNTETEIYNKSQMYYVHEVRDDNNNVIKSLGNFTLHDKSHEPTFIPTDWTFVYAGDHNSSVYEGDEGLLEAVTSNAIGNHEQNVRFDDDIMIGLMYYSDNSTDFYRYGFNGFGFDDLESFHVNGTSINGDYDHGYYLSKFSPNLPNGTEIKSFNIESKYLSSAQKDFLQDFDRRRNEYLKNEEINAIYDAADYVSNSYARNQENQNSKSKYSTYYGTNGYGVIRSY